MKKLELGVAYHDNRILKHVKEDMQDIVRHNMNLVVHPYTDVDMKMHKQVMKDIFSVTRDSGLDFWVDAFGVSGPPNAPSHITQFYPGTNRVYSNGEVDPWNICFNAPGLLEFSKLWIDSVGEIGGRKLFWDEPHLELEADGTYACRCERCQKLFYEKYGYEMPKTVNDDVKKFRIDSMAGYFANVTKYAYDNGMENHVCLMPVSLGFTESVIDLPYLHNVGTDPYWYGTDNEPYSYVYNAAANFVEQGKKYNKKSHVWIHSFNVPAGKEEEIFLATDAAYDAGMRTILAWSFRGGEACDYRSDNCELVWQTTGEAMARLRQRYADDLKSTIKKK